MSYQDKHGHTVVFKNDRHQFSVTWDFDTDPNDKSQRIVDLLYVPDLAKAAHEHIRLAHDEARALRDWLSAFLADIGQP